MFVAYVKQHLATALGPGDIVIMDNLPVHKAAGLRAAIEAVGGTVFHLPPYRPDLKPIERVFAN